MKHKPFYLGLFKGYYSLFAPSFLMLCLIITSCGGDNPDVCAEPKALYSEDGPVPDKKLLSDYILATGNSITEEEPNNSEVRFYYDGSSGINEAFSSPGSKDICQQQLVQINNSFQRPGVSLQYYEVLDKINAKGSQLGKSPSNYFTDVATYQPENGPSADLASALNDIIKFNGVSIFVTDAEQFQADQEVPVDAWASKPMQEWLNGGNSIYFWITDFDTKRKNKLVPATTQKHLYFIAFVPASSATDDNVSDFIKSMTDINPKNYKLTKQYWKINKPDWGEQETGLDKNLLLESVFEKSAYFRELNSRTTNYEYMSIELPIDAKYLTGQSLTQQQFYRNLTIDLSNNKFYTVTNIDIDAYDVTEDLNNFYKYNEIIKVSPGVKKDPNTVAIIIDSSSSNYACHYELKNDKPVLKDAKKYQESYKKDKKILEFFEFDATIFKNSIKNGIANVELAIKPHAKFNDQNPLLKGENGYKIIRVDFKISESSPESMSDEMKKALTWTSKHTNSENSGFYSSVIEAIKATDPKGEIIHSLFIKFYTKN